MLHKLLEDPRLEKAALQHLNAQQITFKHRILEGWFVYKLCDEQGLPLEVIRLWCKNHGVIIDEWNLRLCMYVSGKNVPKPVFGLIPRFAEKD